MRGFLCPAGRDRRAFVVSAVFFDSTYTYMKFLLT
nr:MAG TPA: hypothetical protein [Caudoviricetes sp.]